MKLENQVISLQQAKRLKELGVNQDSLFYHTHFTGNGDGYFFSSKCNDIKHIKECVNYEEIGNYDYENAPLTPTGANRAGRYKIASAFTVAELGVMLPEEVKTTKHFGSRGMAMSDGLTGEYFTCESEYESTHSLYEARAKASQLIYMLTHNLTTAAEVNERLKLN